MLKVGRVRRFAMTANAVRLTWDVAILDVNGAHGSVKDLVSDRFYIVTEGSGYFLIEGVEHQVDVDDVVVIPRNTVYDFRGVMRLVVFCSPPFDPKKRCSGLKVERN